MGKIVVILSVKIANVLRHLTEEQLVKNRNQTMLLCTVFFLLGCTATLFVGWAVKYKSRNESAVAVATTGEKILAKTNTMEARVGLVNTSNVTIHIRERLVDTFESFDRNGESRIARGPATGQVAQLVKKLYEIDGITRVSFNQYEIQLSLASQYNWKNVGEKVSNIINLVLETSPETRQRSQKDTSS